MTFFVCSKGAAKEGSMLLILLECFQQWVTCETHLVVQYLLLAVNKVALSSLSKGNLSPPDSWSELLAGDDLEATLRESLSSLSMEDDLDSVNGDSPRQRLSEGTTKGVERLSFKPSDVVVELQGVEEQVGRVASCSRDPTGRPDLGEIESRLFRPGVSGNSFSRAVGRIPPLNMFISMKPFVLFHFYLN